MSTENGALQNELRELKIKAGLLSEVPCTEQETEEYQKLLENNETLPTGVYSRDKILSENNTFYTVHGESELTEAEKKEYIALKQLKYVKTIKNCVLFFTILTILSMALAVLLLIFPLFDF